MAATPVVEQRGRWAVSRWLSREAPRGRPYRNPVSEPWPQPPRFLDLGRNSRFHTEAQRLALIIEQQTCQHPACDVPGAFCHVHHTIAWSNGGPTDTTHAVLLCPFHHHAAHRAHTTGTTYPLRT